MPYENRYIGFVDILGFSEQVRQSAGHPALSVQIQLRLNTIAQQAHQFAAGLQETDLRVTHFSDCLAFSTPASDLGLWALLLSCDAIQHNLWPAEVVLRGGIAKGELHHDVQPQQGLPIIFGPAFLDAYDLESKIAKYPRIVMSDDVYADAVASSAGPRFNGYAERHLLVSQFDRPCINPFSDLVYRLNHGLAHPQSGQRMRAIRNLIVGRLSNAQRNAEIVSKWVWLALRFNDLIQQAPALGLTAIQV